MTIRSLPPSAVFCLCSIVVQAGPQRLDDSRSYAVPPAAQMQWTPQTRSDGGMEAWVRVNIHIDTRDGMGRSGRI